MIISNNSALASASGAGNMVLIKSKNNNESIFAGPGAGRYPTANSVVNDILRLNLGQVTKPFPIENNFEPHISLAYGNHDLISKKELIRQERMSSLVENGLLITP